jgi:hypothetical protein
MSFLSRIDDIAGLFSLGGDAVIELLAGIVDGVSVGTEFSGEQLDRLGELGQELAEKVRGLKGGGEQTEG